MKLMLFLFKNKWFIMNSKKRNLYEIFDQLTKENLIFLEFIEIFLIPICHSNLIQKRDIGHLFKRNRIWMWKECIHLNLRQPVHKVLFATCVQLIPSHHSFHGRVTWSDLALAVHWLWLLNARKFHRNFHCYMPWLVHKVTFFLLSTV